MWRLRRVQHGPSLNGTANDRVSGICRGYCWCVLAITGLITIIDIIIND